MAAPLELARCSLWSHKPPFGSYEYYTRKIIFVPFFLRKSIVIGFVLNKLLKVSVLIEGGAAGRN